MQKIKDFISRDYPHKKKPSQSVREDVDNEFVLLFSLNFDTLNFKFRGQSRGIKFLCESSDAVKMKKRYRLGICSTTGCGKI